MPKKMHDFDYYLLTPKHSSINSRSNVKTDNEITKGLKIFHPIVASPMNTVCEYQMANAMCETGSYGFLHRYMPIMQQVSFATLIGKPAVSIGVNGDSKERFDTLYNKADIKMVTIDVAHGDTDSCLDMVKYIKHEYGDNVKVISGNIVTIDAAHRYENVDVDCFRVGIGAGSACTTRIITGVGYNQLRA